MNDAKKVALFDRIFTPQHIVLANGHEIDRPRSRTPLIMLVLIACIIASIQLTGFDLGMIFSRAEQLTKILGKIVQPEWEYFSNVTGPLFDTIKMSLLGSIIGCVLALPFAVIASSNVNKNKPILLAIRLFLSIIRTFPTLIIANVCALIFSLGTFAGCVAIIIFTFGVVSKMLFESIETIDMGPFEAMESLGANKFEAFWTACIPQILPTYLSHCLYCFEMNVRAASILGYVGAGGLGILINEVIGWRNYNRLGMVLLTLFVTVFTIDTISEYLRKKLS